MNADDDQSRSAVRYQLHREYAVPVTEVEVDEQLLAWLHRSLPTAANQPTAAALSTEGCQEGMIYPVVERGDRLVLVAEFSSFVALREAGAVWTTVYLLDAVDERELQELALAIAVGDGS